MATTHLGAAGRNLKPGLQKIARVAEYSIDFLKSPLNFG